MAIPLSGALARYNGNYDTLFNPGQVLQRDSKKGWAIARTQVSSKKQAEFFDQLVASLMREDFGNIPNPEALAIRMNFWLQKPIIPKALPEVILFKSTCKTFGFLSNFFQSIIISNGKLFRSSEHFYQWSIVALIDPDGAENHYGRMADLDSLKSRKYSHEIQAKSRKPEDAEKLQVMEHVATLKFQQNLLLAEALAATHPVPLVENTESTFWGGETNHMGRILERVRVMSIG